ncbi:glycosyltransferase family 4 protein [Patescibacteria group bacterium]|nr:glycosyltransferase family 4 protein [Patescibacteria group bacterium]
MKIAIDISQIVYGTGVSVYTENLVKTLVKKYSQVDWVLFGGVFRKKKIIEDFIENLQVKGVIKLFPPKLADLVWNKLHIFPIENWIGNVDLIHSSDWAEPPSKIPKITTVHDLVPLMYPETTTSLIKIAHEKRLSWIKKESKRIIAVSESTKNDLVKHLGIKANRIDVTYEGVEDIYYPRTHNEIERIKYKYQIDGEYLFSLSTLEPRKNQGKLIEAFKRIRLKYPNLKLVLGGRVGWGDELKLSENIITLGYIPTKDLPAIFSGSLVYILPSLYEGFGLSQLQAMSCGTPVVTSNISSMPEVVGDAGLLVNPYKTRDIAEGIITAIKDRKKLIKRGLLRAKTFSWDLVAERTFNSYKSILNP